LGTFHDCVDGGDGVNTKNVKCSCNGSNAMRPTGVLVGDHANAIASKLMPVSVTLAWMPPPSCALPERRSGAVGSPRFTSGPRGLFGCR
jgi:hypothetical protein